MDKAIKDLHWISERLSGIIALKDELEDMQKLKNHKSELTGHIQKLKSEAEALDKEAKSTKASAKAAMDKASAKLSEREKEAEEVIAQADKMAKDTLAAAKVEAKAMIEAANVKAAEINEKNWLGEQKLLELDGRIKEAEDRLTKAQTDLESLKNKL